VCGTGTGWAPDAEFATKIPNIDSMREEADESDDSVAAWPSTDDWRAPTCVEVLDRRSFQVCERSGLGEKGVKRRLCGVNGCSCWGWRGAFCGRLGAFDQSDEATESRSALLRLLSPHRSFGRRLRGIREQVVETDSG
jgi:hypothetical protein